MMADRTVSVPIMAGIGVPVVVFCLSYLHNSTFHPDRRQEEIRAGNTRAT